MELAEVGKDVKLEKEGPSRMGYDELRSPGRFRSGAQVCECKNVAFGRGHVPSRSVKWVHEQLRMCAPPELLSHRPGPGGTKMYYLGGTEMLFLMQYVFGSDGWTSWNVDMRQVGESTDPRSGKVTVHWACTVHVKIHEAFGGRELSADGFGSATEATAYAGWSNAQKEAQTDGLKRCFMLLGEPWNCSRSKLYLAWAQAELRKNNPKREYEVMSLRRVPEASYGGSVRSLTGVPAKEETAVEDVFDSEEFEFDGMDDE
jgi:recombination DNA repair RAD52 pathway protein